MHCSNKIGVGTLHRRRIRKLRPTQIGVHTPGCTRLQAPNSHPTSCENRSCRFLAQRHRPNQNEVKLWAGRKKQQNSKKSFPQRTQSFAHLSQSFALTCKQQTTGPTEKKKPEKYISLNSTFLFFFLSFISFTTGLT